MPPADQMQDAVLETFAFSSSSLYDDLDSCFADEELRLISQQSANNVSTLPEICFHIEDIANIVSDPPKIISKVRSPKQCFGVRIFFSFTMHAIK